MVDALVAAARRRGSHSVVVSTDTPWRDAVALYRSCGFVVTHVDQTDTHLELPLDPVRGDPGTSFDQVPDLYDTVRPSYPQWFFDRLFDLLPSGPAVLEVGPGTGQATSELLDRTANVTAVEPGHRMATMLRKRFGEFDGFVVVEDRFESAELPLAGFDAVVAATAYHWIEPSRQVARPAELLAPGGVLGIIDLIQVGSSSDLGYFERVQPIYASFQQDRHDWHLPTYESAMPAIAAVLSASDRFEQPIVLRCPWDQTYTAAAYRDLLMTYSGTRMMPAAERVSLVDQLIAVVDDEYAGVITRPLVATLTLACRRGN
jgi:SAM-dependent methyltransferase